MAFHARVVLFAATLAAASASGSARAQSQPDGAALLRMMGSRATAAFAPKGAQALGALVRLPAGVRGRDVGLVDVAPGIARLRGAPSGILAFADAHPDLPIEVSPPLHLLLDTAVKFVHADLAVQQGLDGSGVLVGIADTGIDVTHPDFLDPQGKTRIAWLLDLSAPPRGVYPDLEKAYGSTDPSGNLVAGAVWAAKDIDDGIQRHRPLNVGLPQDEVGHGTLVASCAAGDGSAGPPHYPGVAPNATLLIARIAGPGTPAIGNDDLLRGVAFLFDRADNLKQPVVVNLSIGTDFGPHDGTTAWEQTLASYVGPQHPGRAMVAAAGNSGSIADTPIHQNVHVDSGGSMRLPIMTSGASDGGVQAWVALHPGADLKVGLDGPDGTWIKPVASGLSGGKTTSDYNAGVYNGSSVAGSPVPAQSRGAVVAWQGKWPSGKYAIVLSGTGTADVYLEGTGDASQDVGNVGFLDGVREGTINLPASHPSIIGVGCTINKPRWVSESGVGIGLSVPILDAPGGMLQGGAAPRDAVAGEPCWFSSAGPTLTGVQKPEIMAPGAALIGAMSEQAVPPAVASIYTNPLCPAGSGSEEDCQVVDTLHGVSFGTSFSSPIVAGAVAVLLQRDPTLTQDEIVAALQGGAHPLRGPASFEDQAGVGEVDVLGAVEVADLLRHPGLAFPVAAESWLTLGADFCLADGSTPLQVVLELRAARGGSPSAPPADGFSADHLGVYAVVD
ncbi:MAG TPA: S8 family serine peptidase, partial [Polyangiaceae bacterium]|nr:S8 family serine peptidase [Polyangiaceae bacterium]